jgi:hypothetical protein
VGVATLNESEQFVHQVDVTLASCFDQRETIFFRRVKGFVKNRLCALELLRRFVDGGQGATPNPEVVFPRQ